MELWILTVFALKSKLNAAAASLTERAQAWAQNWEEDVFATCNKIIEINDEKRRIVNLKVLCEAAEKALGETERNVLTMYVKKSVAEIADRLSMSASAVYRTLMRAFSKAEKAFAKLKFDEAAFERDYRPLTLCALTYAKIKRDKVRRKIRRTECQPTFAALAY